MSLHFIDGDNDGAYDAIIAEFKDGRWPNIYKKHIFYNRLKSYKGSKKNLFDTFHEYLNKLDINKITNLIAELKGFDVKVGESERLVKYLYCLKQDSNKFCTILLSLII